MRVRNLLFIQQRHIDHNYLKGFVVFANGSSTAQIHLNPTVDGIDETDTVNNIFEKVTLSLSSNPAYDIPLLVTDNRATVTIVDNDQGDNISTLSMTMIDNTLNETTNTATFRITRTGGDLSKELIVFLEAEGTAVSPYVSFIGRVRPVELSVDYEIPNYIVIPGITSGNETSVDVNISGISDLLTVGTEGNETIVLNLVSHPDVYHIDNTASSVGFNLSDVGLLRDPTPPVKQVISINSTPPDGILETGNYSWTLQRYHPESQPGEIGSYYTNALISYYEVVIHKADGSVITKDGFVEFQANSTLATVDLSKYSNLLDAGDSVTLNIKPHTVYDLAANNISDNTQVVENIISVTATATQFSEAGGSTTLTFTREGNTDSPITIKLDSLGLNFNTIPGKTEAADESEDYNLSATEITIPAGVSTYKVDITGIDDSLYEGTQAFSLNFSSDDNLYFTQSSLQFRITDNDAGSNFIRVATMAEAPILVMENANSLDVTFKTSAGFNFGFGTNLFEVKTTIIGDSTNGIDYTLASNSLILDPNSNSADFNIGLLDDQSIENPETLQITFSHGGTLNAATSNVIKILDNDDPINTVGIYAVKAGTLMQYDVSNTIKEGENANFVVYRSGNLDNELTINLNYSGSTAIANADYHPVNSVTFKAGEYYKIISLQTLENNLVETAEHINIAITPDTTESYKVDDWNSTTININDNDSLIGLTINTIVIGGRIPETEEALDTRIMITRSGDTSASIDVGYILGGTAMIGQDYTAPNNSLTGTITLAAGQTSAYIPILIKADNMVERDETLTIQLTNGDGYELSTSGLNGRTLTIVNDDFLNTTPVLSFSQSSSTTSEGKAITLIISSNTTVSKDTEIYLTTATDTTVNDNDIIGGIPKTATILAGKNYAEVTLNIANDSILEGKETLNLSIADTSYYDIGANQTLSLLINDNV